MAERPLPAYEGDERYIFVAWTHEDAGLVLPEIRWLQEQGFNVWWDEGISPGAVWRAEVAVAIQHCSLLLYFVTPRAAVSDHCTREVNFALDEHHRPVLAVHLADTTLPGALMLSLGDRQAILRHTLEPADYERKLISAVATYLDQPLPEIPSGKPRGIARHNALRMTAAISFLLGGGVASLATLGIFDQERETEPVSSRFEIIAPTGVTVLDGPQPLAISSDGRNIVFGGGVVDRFQLYRRPLEELVGQPIPGTDGGGRIFSLSPDGGWIAFWHDPDNAIKKIRLTGGAAATITELSNAPIGLSWGSDGAIYFSGGRFGQPLMRVSSDGGEPEILARPESGESFAHPVVTSDASVVLFDVGWGWTRNRIEALSLSTGERRTIVAGGYPQIVANERLVFRREGAIWMAPFDARRPQVLGSAVPVLEDSRATGTARSLAIANDGSIVYLPNTLGPSDTLVWKRLDGQEVTIPVPPGVYGQPRISPDGTRATVRRENDSLWVLELEQNTLTMVRRDNVITNLWSPDGTKILYTLVEGTPNIYWRNADGTGMETRLAASDRAQYPMSRSPDGREVLYYECDPPSRNCDLGRMILGDQPQAELILQTEASESHPALSPDGRWVAYHSDRSGRPEVYVRPYPDIDSGRWKVSDEGGRHPFWSKDGTMLYYNVGDSVDRRMMAVSIDTRHEFAVGNPTPIFGFQQAFRRFLRSHDLHPDGDRLLMVKPGVGLEVDRLVYVPNWLDEVVR
jgi:serine/threonine-protein kinase